MTVSTHGKRRLADLLMTHADSPFRRKHPEWAQAMVSESSTLLSDTERLRWSVGRAVASYHAPGVLDWATYPAALGAGVVLMTAYQWSADESLRTVTMLSLIGMALGALQPQRCLLSGVAIGLVVAAVNSFETISGVRPAYEATAHSLLHGARWTVFTAPALIAALVGGYDGRKLRSLTRVRS